MTLPRWTAYVALAVIAVLIVSGIPRRGSTVDSRLRGARTGLRAPAAAPRVVAFGIDGLDPNTLREVMDRRPEGMANFRRLAAMGEGVRDLGASPRPHEPAAWSSFITGGPSGEPFWSQLVKASVRADLYRLPVHFPRVSTTELDANPGPDLVFAADPLGDEELVRLEQRQMLDRALQGFRQSGEGGFVFFHVWSADLARHMLQDHQDPDRRSSDRALAGEGPNDRPSALDPSWGAAVDDIYLRLDVLLGLVFDGVPQDTTVIVMSDRGFAARHRELSLNPWLLHRDQGLRSADGQPTGPDPAPGVLLTNGILSSQTPRLEDLTASILGIYGVKPAPSVIGTAVLAPAE